MNDELKTLYLESEEDDFLAHHGTKGMRWGIWNAETRAKYFGSFKKHAKLSKDAVAKRFGERAAKAKQKADARAAKRAEQKAAKKEAKAIAKAKKLEEKEFDKETMKKYGLSKKKYEKLREQTLNTTDPEKVAKGMHLLNDDELRKKIDRINLEDSIRRSAYSKADQEAKAKQAKSEAFNKSIRGKIVKSVIDKGVNEVVGGAATAFKVNAVTPYVTSISKRYADKGVAAIEKMNKRDAEAAQREADQKEIQERKNSSGARIGQINARKAMNSLQALEDNWNRRETEAVKQEIDHAKQVADEGAARVDELRKKAS